MEKNYQDAVMGLTSNAIKASSIISTGPPEDGNSNAQDSFLVSPRTEKRESQKETVPFQSASNNHLATDCQVDDREENIPFQPASYNHSASHC